MLAHGFIKNPVSRDSASVPNGYGRIAEFWSSGTPSIVIGKEMRRTKDEKAEPQVVDRGTVREGCLLQVERTQERVILLHNIPYGLRALPRTFDLF